MKPCAASGKRRLLSLQHAKGHAHKKARAANAAGELSVDSYAYVCPHCRRWHVTRRAEWNGKPNIQVFFAPPESLQRWAMGDG